MVLFKKESQRVSFYGDWYCYRCSLDPEEGWNFKFYFFPCLEVEHSGNDILRGKLGIEHVFLGGTSIRLSWLFLQIELFIRNKRKEK